MGLTILEVRALGVRYGSQTALSDVSFGLAAGEVLAVLGDNGSGRTTLLRAIAGATAHAQGTVVWHGRDISGLSTARRVELGISMVSGTSGVFAHLSVAENLLTGCHRFGWDRTRVTARVEAVIDIFGRLGDRLDQTAGSLSGGEQQMLAIAKALAGQPELLLIDEPSLGLAPAAIAQLTAALTRLRTDGLTMIVVERSVHAARGFAERVLSLDRGRVRFDGPLEAMGITP